MLKRLALSFCALLASISLAHAAAIPLYSPSYSNGILDVTVLNQAITALNNITGGGTAAPGTFSTLSATSTVSGAGFTARFAAPGPIGNTTPSTGAFTTLSASSTVSGTGFSTYLASPPAIGGTAAAAGTFTTLQNTTAAGLTVAVSTDATHTDATLCEDTTTHVVYFGSGTAGICLGTSSLRFKHDVEPLSAGLDAVLALEPISYKLNADHGDPDATLYGFSAEQGGQVLPQLMHRDLAGKPNAFDYLGVVPVLVRAIQQQQAEIEQLKRHAAR